VLGLLAVLGLATTWHVYLIAFAFGLGTAFDTPARQTFVSEVAGAEHLPNAIGLNSATFNAARIVGPAVHLSIVNSRLSSSGSRARTQLGAIGGSSVS